MTDKEIINRARSRIGKNNHRLVELLFECRDAFDSIAYEIRQQAGTLSEDNWNESYHLGCTITVGDARKVFRLIGVLDKLFKGG